MSHFLMTFVLGAMNNRLIGKRFGANYQRSRSPRSFGKSLASVALVLLLLAVNAPAQVTKPTKFSFTPPAHVTRSDLYSVHTTDAPRAVLVLCPGTNGNGGDWIRQPEWQSFARENRLGLVGLSFESDPADPGHGYHYVRDGSGQLLLDGIRKIYGKDLPLLLFGFSRGAVFACRFADWQPQRLLVWCGYSPGEGDEQSIHQNAPPGLIACGEDDSNYGRDLFYFKNGRALGKSWLWLSLAHTGHNRSAIMEDFARRYFVSALALKKEAVWIDVDEKIEITPQQAKEEPALTGFIPDRGLLGAWDAIHDP
jgi:hypothetical protein